MTKIVFTGGGSAGHIMPNIALIEELKIFDIYYIGTDGMEKKILENYKNVKFITIPAVKFIRSFTLKNLAIPFKLIKSINICKRILKEIKPDIIFSKGGYVSIPVCLAGAKLNTPILTHESDYSIGLANKIIARKSKYLCCSFKETCDSYKKNSVYTGSPIRPSILTGNREIVLKRHNIKKDAKIILIIGGSLGAKAINDVIWQNLDKLCKTYTIIHIVGKNNKNTTIKNIPNYIQLEFASDIQNYFSACDIAISRAGSNTIFELLSIAKPMILIPLPKTTSRGDQILNAKNFEKKKIAYLLEQENLTFETLKKAIDYTYKNKESYIANMKNASKNIGNKKIIDLINTTVKNS